MGPASNTEVAFQNVYGLKTGQAYTISAWVKAAAATSTTVSLCLDDTHNGNWSCGPNTVPGTSWQQLSWSYTVPADGAMSIQLSEAAGSATTYWDDVAW